MRAIAKVNVRRAGFIPLDKCARAWALKRVSSFVVFLEIRFRLHDRPSALAPNQFRPDQVAGARDRIAAKE